MSRVISTRRTVVVLLLAAGALLLPTAANADCVATMNSTFSGNNDYILNLHYFAQATGDNSCHIDVYESDDYGPWNWAFGGYGSTVRSDPSQGISCVAEGTHSIRIQADCGGYNLCPRQWSGIAETTYTVSHGVSIDSAQLGPKYLSYGSSYRQIDAKVSWQDSWPTTVGVAAREILTKNVNPQRYGRDYDGIDSNRTSHIPMPIHLGQNIWRLEAKACDKVAFAVVGDDVTTSCPNCGDSFGGPVLAANGNMVFTDADPLPSTGVSLTRTYNSISVDTGVFGRSWVSFLDQWLRSESEDDGSTTVVIGTSTDGRYVFNGTNGSFRQLWPVGRASATLTQTNGTFTLRQFGSHVDQLFDSNGRIVQVHNVPDNHNVNVAYDANGLITRVEDSWGNWAWVVTTNPTTRTITSIAVEGTAVAWSYGYDGSNNLTTVTEGGATWRTYNYSAGPLTEVRDAKGNLIESHAYGANGATTSIGQTDDITDVQYGIAASDPNETITQVTYATGAQALYYVKPAGNRLRTSHVEGGCASCSSRDAIYAYDDNGRLVRQQDARGYITESAYDSLNRLIIETNALIPTGCDPSTAADLCRLPGTLGSAPSLSLTSASLTKSITYDPLWPDRPATITTTSVINPSGSRVESYQYDTTTGEVLLHSTSGWTGSVAQPLQETHTTWTALYNGSEGSAFAPSGAFDSSWLSLPQPAGLKKWIDGPRTDVTDLTSFVYYPVNPAVPSTWRGRLAAIRNAAGQITRLENYDVFGNAQRTVDANGVVTEVSFDHLGRPLTSTLKGVTGCDTTADPLCASDIVSSRNYSPATGPLASQTDARGNVNVYEYDSRGRISATSRGDSPASLKERIEYTYDPATGKKSIEKYLAMQDGSWVEKRRESYGYDSLSQLTTQTHADTTSIGYDHDSSGAVRSVRDENHAAANTNYTYDPAGRLATVRQTLSTAPGGTITTAYLYDVQGNLTRVTDPNGNGTTYQYDDFGRMLTQSSPVTGTTTYSYDLAGDLVTTTDANGATTSRTYDSLGRVLTSSSACSGTDTETTSWTYDDPTTTANFGVGRLASMANEDSVTSYTYTRTGRVGQESLAIAGVSSCTWCWGGGERAEWETSVRYEYDAAGNRTRLGQQHFTYDFANRPVSVTWLDCDECAPYSIITSASYLPFGPESEIVFSSGARQLKTYDNRYRLQENKLTTSSGGTVADYSISFDDGSNITHVNDLLDATYNRTFGYDDLNRLTNASTGTSLWGTGAYTYDSMGNMVSSSLGETNQTLSYVGTTPRIASLTVNGRSNSFSYDAAGNEVAAAYAPPTTGNATANVTDSRGVSCRNLVTTSYTEAAYSGGCPEGHYCPPNVNLVQHSFAYEYDGRGMRVHMSDGGSYNTDYVYTPELSLSTIHHDDDDSAIHYVYFNGHPIAQLSSDPSSNQLGRPIFTLTDHLGTPVLQFDNQSSVVWRAEYEPYGRIFKMRNGAWADQLLRFPGQIAADETTGGFDLNYNIFRWYEPNWGRYTQSDPISSDLNLYAYTRDNPVDSIDPLGLVTVDDTITTFFFSDVNEWLGKCARFKAGGECSVIGAFVDGGCEGEGGCWQAKTKFVLTGDINLFTGKFRDLPMGFRPDDPNITNASQAYDHAYRLHINPSVKKAVAVLAKLEKMTFSSREVCNDFFNKYSADALKAFVDEMKSTETWERRGKRR